MKWFELIAIAVCSFFAAEASAQSGTYGIDQSASGSQPVSGMPTAPGNSTYNNGPVGQSFTPTLTGINFVAFTLAKFGSAAQAPLSVSLYQGLGFSANRVLLGTTNTVNLTNTSYASIQFDFSNVIALVPNTTYSFVFNNLGCVNAGANCQADGSVLTAGGDTYSGGGAFRGGFQGDDYTFSEGIFTAGTPGSAVPEPATWAMLMLGMGAVGYAMRRRKAIALVSSVA